MKEIAARVTGMAEPEVRDLVYRAAESCVACQGMDDGWFEVKRFSDAVAARWLLYACERATEDFVFTIGVQRSLSCGANYVVFGRVRFLDRSPIPPKQRELPSPTLIALKERVAGIELPALEREMETFLQTADFSTGRSMFRDGLARGPAYCMQWMINYAFACDDVYAEYARTSPMFETYQVFVSLGRSECKFSSFS